VSDKINHRVDETLKNWKSPFQEKESSWYAIESKMDKHLAPAAKVIPLRTFLKIAAAITLVLGLAWFMQPTEQMILAETTAGQHIEHTLPDGSVVTVNAMSSISYDADAFMENRSLELKGEAFFQVQKGSSFTVHSAQGDVTVLGTSFNMNSRDDVFHVLCTTGKVYVERGSASVILTPGLEVRAAGNELGEVKEISVEPKWREGRFLFTERPVYEVFEELERQFGIAIDQGSPEDGLFTGEFDRTDLESALEVVCNTMGFAYELDSERMKVTVRTN